MKIILLTIVIGFVVLANSAPISDKNDAESLAGQNYRFKRGLLSCLKPRVSCDEGDDEDDDGLSLNLNSDKDPDPTRVSAIQQLQAEGIDLKDLLKRGQKKKALDIEGNTVDSLEETDADDDNETEVVKTDNNNM